MGDSSSRSEAKAPLHVWSTLLPPLILGLL